MITIYAGCSILGQDVRIHLPLSPWKRLQLAWWVLRGKHWNISEGEVELGRYRPAPRLPLLERMP